MLKKLILVVATIVVATVVGCSSQVQVEMMDQVEPLHDIMPAIETLFEIEPFYIEIVDDDNLEVISSRLVVNYSESLGGFITEGLNLKIYFWEPVTNFTLFTIDGDISADENHNQVVLQLSHIDHGVPLIVTHYPTQSFSSEASVVSGLSFINKNGSFQRFRFEVNQQSNQVNWIQID